MLAKGMNRRDEEKALEITEILQAKEIETIIKTVKYLPFGENRREKVNCEYVREKE